jgi:hypothetical protein
MKGFRGGLVCKAHRLLNHLTLGWRVIKKKKKMFSYPNARPINATLRFKNPGNTALRANRPVQG